MTVPFTRLCLASLSTQLQPPTRPPCLGRITPGWLFCSVLQVRYTNSSQKVPDFPLEPESALELLMAANFLDC
jgi:hypothetical protein